MNNITYTDTGYIDGFSSSLINIGNGFLLGIGRENNRYDKVEVYAEAEGEVISVAKYLIDGTVSSEYKAYYINREECLFGFGVSLNYYSVKEDSGYRYILLKFTDSSLVEIVSTELISLPDDMRAVMIDGYLYMLGDCDFRVQAVELN
jgi:uncharacterized secreted protein with C-terminal beta-propeller domain